MKGEGGIYPPALRMAHRAYSPLFVAGTFPFEIFR